MSYVFRAPAPSHLAWGDQAVDELFNGYFTYLLAKCKKEVRKSFPTPRDRAPKPYSLHFVKKHCVPLGYAVLLVLNAVSTECCYAAVAFSVTTRTLLSTT